MVLGTRIRELMQVRGKEFSSESIRWLFDPTSNYPSSFLVPSCLNTTFLDGTFLKESQWNQVPTNVLEFCSTFAQKTPLQKSTKGVFFSAWVPHLQ